MEKILEVTGLTKHYPSFGLEDVSFSLEPGYIMGLIGPNGAGKSTTVKCIMNLIRKERGSVSICGLDMQLHEKQLKDRIGFVYDEAYWYGILTVRDMKNIIAPFYSRWDEKLFMEHLDRFDIDPGKKIDDLSRGMKTKFSLSVALSHGAQFIVMDEPTSGLDPVFRSDLLDVLYEVIQDGTVSILFSTHITSDLERIADYITFLNNGRVVFTDTKDEVLERHSIVRGGADLLDRDIEELLVGYRITGTLFEGLTRKRENVMALFGDAAVIEPANLDDIMLYTVKGRNYVATRI